MRGADGSRSTPPRRTAVHNPFRIGTQIYLRPLERADAPRLVPWFNDPEVTRYLAVHRPLNLQQEEEFLARLGQSEHDVVLGIAVGQDDALIGVTGLHRIDYTHRHADFGISIGTRSEWGKGYGTEATTLMLQYAFEGLNLHRVRLLVYEDNACGRHVYEKIGFRREGVLRQERYAAGRYWDTITMAMLREEWEARRSGTMPR
jgi:diamine N-acetyltransferase